ncbi:hypothetical protein AOL_s00043g552 [Orbilia oligospora ATCC 24927]|uniref:Uncharacterized protein n=2 Tax=Orbilia oligospora TaxID=2813651 RepID=G1X4C8_ARTOA|nr:hypothetical protein AOL_s00043g552 [Orbilia oligospora ATCC 24927]EGX51818.1 hypothetical protein AOL_s00043g552 [Orbilia oligospora ATCC 24927]KAF3289659.1 hypothetical protein TWF970_003426 [Orbilia oligospora]
MENLPRGRRSRRSSSNLNLSNISPLTTHFSMTAPDDHLAMTGPQTSYIQGASAPSTPSILSRNPSRKRSRPHIPPLSVPATPRGDTKLYKAKSASHLLADRRISYFDSRPVRRNESTEWVHRAGIALTSEARESKGQSWLTSRASSTSLLSNGSDAEEDGDEIIQRRGSRSYSEFYTPRSRIASDATIRRRSHSRQQELYVEIPEDGVHPLAPEFIDEAFAGESFDDFEEPEYTAEELDDEELHWSKRPRTGLGAWVDRMVGWSLFSVDDGMDSDEEHEHEHEHPAVKEAHEPPRLNIPNYETGKAETEERPASPELHEDGVLSDVGWVLGLTVKVFLQG